MNTDQDFRGGEQLQNTNKTVSFGKKEENTIMKTKKKSTRCHWSTQEN